MIYCDMDGVLVDFRKEVSSRLGIDITSKEFDDLGQGKRNKLYAEACDTVDFWTCLEPMPDYNELWGYIKYWNPHILTAFPMWSKEGIEVAIKGKEIWNKAHMMVPDVRFHCVARVDKQMYALNKQGYADGRANLLIDDKDKNIWEWEAKGGVGILHTSAAKTIARLKEIGYTK